MIREATRDDAPALMACWNDAMPFDRLSFELLHEKLWADPDMVPGDILMDVRDGRVAGFGATVRRPGREIGFIKLYTVAHHHRQKGIGTALLDALEARLRTHGCSAVRLGESAPNYLVPGLDVRYEEAGLFFRRRDYRPVGRTMNLRVDLGVLDPPDMSDHDVDWGAYHVRRAGPDDHDALMVLINRLWPAWQPEVGQALANDPATVHVAVCGYRHASPGAVAAFAACEANNRGAGWFGPMGTDPDHRGHGLGRLLLRRSLEDLRQRGASDAVIPWVGPVGFYHDAVGAQIARVFERMEKPLR